MVLSGVFWCSHACCGARRLLWFSQAYRGARSYGVVLTGMLRRSQATVLLTGILLVLAGPLWCLLAGCCSTGRVRHAVEHTCGARWLLWYWPSSASLAVWWWQAHSGSRRHVAELPGHRGARRHIPGALRHTVMLAGYCGIGGVQRTVVQTCGARHLLRY